MDLHVFPILNPPPTSLKRSGLKHSIQKMKVMASSIITLWHIDGETMETVRDFILRGSKITADGE